MKIQEYITEKEKEELQIYGIINVLEKFCRPFINEMQRTGLKDWFYRGSHHVGSKKMIKMKPRSDRKPSDMVESMQEYLDDLFYQKFKWRPRSEGVFTTGKKSVAKNYSSGGGTGIFLPIGKNYKYVYNPNIADLYSELDDNAIDSPDEYEEYYNEDEWRDSYDAEFGYDSYGGSWYYDGEDTGEINFSKAEDYVRQQIIDDGDLDPDEDEDEIDDIFNNIDFEWVPDMPWEDFLENKIEDAKEENANTIKNIVKDYENKNLRKAHSSQVEVTFKCKEYFLVTEEFGNQLKEHFLVGNPQKPDFWQKKFPFEKQVMFKYALV